MSVHPSGRVAISCGRDRTIRLWDLTKGVLATTIRMKQGMKIK